MAWTLYSTEFDKAVFPEKANSLPPRPDSTSTVNIPVERNEDPEHEQRAGGKKERKRERKCEWFSWESNYRTNVMLPDDVTVDPSVRIAFNE